ncbi:MAG: hypothetical protein EWV45_11615 [Microcystis flos-aquae Mf_QC_C_20070823_S10D]|uniref:Uncharacterized protein n=1 Tax=Microcystis flos-aquae Mf_QC_C_20070823_S10D TaxID=2486236 RepID=A0A552KTX1_9CHRO|nr:MAG: hypothetical protein EWV65_12365 [Microcystis flos-aquae Ma_QC_C_20070823_S18D]TRV11345.1 MAG: hypothetical protein EWV45_11615 [Microcystis flos-aquae Mf_QC_C_20070823_S10D]TRV25378.1 MAG: hypothetical protein EWV72_09315 [Microcystis flos-aquae Mf_QC_C_20070823_S10]TRV32883.1 MAG: hypothetical protein EWV70_14635 [Microcystis flos-aquae Mf_QC_C_20070823_S20]TRV38830.1 MAG: hypothetical protein EWV71_06640 [Microcystis flos-aquae Mf_QC_C_20070823_S20D]TRV41678.1 MAG: hypothetical prot
MRNVNLNILNLLQSIDNVCLSLINRGSPNEKIFTPTDERGFFPHTPHPTPHTPHPTPYTPLKKLRQSIARIDGRGFGLG